MRKILIQLLFPTLLVLPSALFAQQAAKTAKKNTASHTQVSNSLSKAKDLAKAWQYSGSEVFGVDKQPSDIQKNDRIVFIDGGSYRWIYNGVTTFGTWTLNGAWITLKANDGTTTMIKLVSCDGNNLTLDYKDADDVHNILKYTAN